MDADVGDFGSIFDTGGGFIGDISDGTFSSTGALYSMDFTNYLFECQNTSKLLIFQNGAWREVDSRADTFNTIIRTDVSSSSNDQLITEFRVDNYVMCNYADTNSGIANLRISNGFTNYQIFTGTTGSNLKVLSQKVIPINDVTLQDEKLTKVSQYRFSASSIEDEIIVNSSGNGWVSANSLHSGTYTITDIDGSKFTSDTGNGISSQVRHYVSVTPDAEPEVDDTSRKNALIRIEQVKQTLFGHIIISDSKRTGQLDTENGQQIAIEGLMRDYKPTDGLPQVKIVGPSSSITINLLLTQIDNDNDGIFRQTFLLPRDVLGQYTLTLTHPLRDGTSEVTFHVITSSDPEPVTDPKDCDDTHLLVDGVCVPKVIVIDDPDDPNPEDRFVTSKFHWIHRYDSVPDCQRINGEDICKLITKTASGITQPKIIALTSLTDQIDFGGQTGVEAVLSEIQLTSVISSNEFETLNDFKRALDSSVSYEAEVEVDNEKFTFAPFVISSPQPNICFGVQKENECFGGNFANLGGMQLDVITISNGKLVNELEKHNIDETGQPVKITVSATGGTFTLLDADNKQHISSALGMTYVYTFTFGATPFDSDNDNSSSNDCTSSDPKVSCGCPEGQTFSVSPQNELICVDIETGDPTGDDPKSDPNDKTNTTEPHCEVQSDGSYKTFGQVSIDDPGCKGLFEGGGDPDETKMCGEFEVPIDFICDDNSDGNMEGDPDKDEDDPPKGDTGTQPVFDCQKAFGSSFCAFAQDPGSLFNNDTQDDLDTTVIGIIVAILIIIILVAVVLSKKKRSPYAYSG